MRRIVAVVALAAGLGACSSPEEAGAPPPTADEKKAVEDASAMIPETEQPSADAAPAATPVLEAVPEVVPTLKPGYGTPVPPAERSE